MSNRFSIFFLFFHSFVFWVEHGLSTEPVPVSAYAGSSKNLKDLKESTPHSGSGRKKKKQATVFRKVS